MANSSTTKAMKASISIADSASWYCAITLLGLILLASIRETVTDESSTVRGNQFSNNRPCDEIYVVGEGETLHTISDKCGDPFIVERNPHIHDPDDVFPGLVIKIITPSQTSSSWSIDVEVVFREISLCILFSYDKREREKGDLNPSFFSMEELKTIIELSDSR